MSSFTREVVSTPNAPKAIGPYSQAIKANGFVFISGQVAFDPATGNLITGGIEQQTEQVLKNLSAVLQAAGFLYVRNVKLGLKDHAIVGLVASLNGLLLLMLISKVPFQLGVYFWSSLVWFAWYVYGRRRTRERL